MASKKVVLSTYQEISDRANQAREIFRRRGIKLHAESSLGRILRVANKVSAAWEEGHRSSHIRQIVEVSLAGRIADAIIAVADEPDALQSLRRIAGNSMDLQHRTQSQGKDHLWELELCDLL